VPRGACGMLAVGFARLCRERDVLERLVAGVRAGQSSVLVLRGEAGVGKTSLLRHLSAAAEGCQIVRAAGVESEMELAFAGLHALCAPMLGRLAHLPSPQRDALSTAFGLSAGPPPDRVTVGLAVLSLVGMAAERCGSKPAWTRRSGSSVPARARARWRDGRDRSCRCQSRSL
jgi:AAA ATPase domain